MRRIAAALLIVVAVLALNGGMLREALAVELAVQAPVPASAGLDAAALRSGKVLSLLLILEALRQTPVSLERSKV